MRQHRITITLRRATIALALVALIIALPDLTGFQKPVRSAAPRVEPSARYGHTLVNIGGALYLFGGQAGGTVFNDLWTFSNNTWSQLTAANTPARVDHSAAVFNGKMFIFGGRDQTFTRKSDIWIYDPSANTWTQPTPSGGPGVRSQHSTVTVGTDIILFGGFGSAGLANANAYLYSPGANTWTQGAVCLCGARYGQSAAAFAGKFTIWGGDTNSGDQNDMWAYDPTGDRWEPVMPQSPVHARLAVPPARTLQGTAQYGDKMWIFGGEASGTKLKDTWEYNFTSNTWTPRGDMASATTQTAVAAISGTQALLFGGKDASGASSQNIVFNPQAGPQVTTYSLYLPLVVR